MTSVEIKQPFNLTGASEKRARWGDWTLLGLSGGATLLTVLTFGMLVWKIVEQATPLYTNSVQGSSPAVHGTP